MSKTDAIDVRNNLDWVGVFGVVCVAQIYTFFPSRTFLIDKPSYEGNTILLLSTINRPMRKS